MGIISDFGFQMSLPGATSDPSILRRCSVQAALRAGVATRQSDEVVLSEAEGVVEGSLEYRPKRSFDSLVRSGHGLLRFVPSDGTSLATTFKIANLKSLSGVLHD